MPLHNFADDRGRLAFQHVIDDWQGVTSGLARCRYCNADFLLHLQAWRGTRLNERVYAAFTLDPDVASVFLRNMRSDFCDLSRHAAEVEALLAACSACVCLVRTIDGQCTDTIHLPDDFKVHRQPWQLLASDSDPVFDQFSLSGPFL